MYAYYMHSSPENILGISVRVLYSANHHRHRRADMNIARSAALTDNL